MAFAKLRQKIRHWRQMNKEYHIKERIADRLKHTDFLKKRRNTRLGRWLYRRALRWRAGTTLDAYEVVLPLNKYFDEIEEVRNRRITKEEAKKRMNEAFTSMRHAIFRQTIRRALIANGIPRNQWKKIWHILSLYEANLMKPNDLKSDLAITSRMATNLQNQLGKKYSPFVRMHIKMFDEALEHAKAYNEYLAEGH